jgi:hypothetical protein
MRRELKAIVNDRNAGDVTTLQNRILWIYSEEGDKKIENNSGSGRRII